MFKKLQFILFLIITFIASIYFFSCKEDTVNPPPNTTDSNVVIYSNVTAVYNRFGGVDTSRQSFDFWLGSSELGGSSFKDALIDDDINLYTQFYIVSGDEYLDYQGSSTRFYKLFNSLDSTGFDSLKTLDVGATLDSLDFTQRNTYESGWGYFLPGQTETPVYSFYLQGKFASGVTKNRVYGVFRVKNVKLVTVPYEGLSITLDIKLNKAGLNSFRK